MQKKSILEVLVDHIHLYEHTAQCSSKNMHASKFSKKLKELKFWSLDYATEVHRQIIKPMLCSSALNESLPGGV